MTTAVISAVASVLTAILVYLGAKFTARSSHDAATQATAASRSDIG